jgi:hypothetical protein
MSEGRRAFSGRVNSLWVMVKASWPPIPLIAFLVFVLSRSHRGIVRDAYIYLGRALADLDPNGVGRDLMFVHDGQFDFSLFRFLTTAMVELFGPGAGAEILASMAALAWFFAAAAFARQFASGAAVWAVVIFATLLPASYGAPHLFSFATWSRSRALSARPWSWQGSPRLRQDAMLFAGVSSRRLSCIRSWRSLGLASSLPSSAWKISAGFGFAPSPALCWS